MKISKVMYLLIILYKNNGVAEYSFLLKKFSENDLGKPRYTIKYALKKRYIEKIIKNGSAIYKLTDTGKEKLLNFLNSIDILRGSNE